MAGTRPRRKEGDRTGKFVEAIAVHYYNLNPAVLKEEPSASDRSEFAGEATR